MSSDRETGAQGIKGQGHSQPLNSHPGLEVSSSGPWFTAVSSGRTARCEQGPGAPVPGTWRNRGLRSLSARCIHISCWMPRSREGQLCGPRTLEAGQTVNSPGESREDTRSLVEPCNRTCTGRTGREGAHRRVGCSHHEDSPLKIQRAVTLIRLLHSQMANSNNTARQRHRSSNCPGENQRDTCQLS